MSDPRDAWTKAEVVLDESACPKCQRETCEGDCDAPRVCLPDDVLIDAATMAAAGRAIAQAGIQYRVDGTVPNYGVAGMLCAYTKVGKSTLALHLGAAVATGTSFLGRATRQARVLVLAAEDPQEYTAWNARHLNVPAEAMTFCCAPLVFDARGLDVIVNTVARDGYGLVLASSWQTLIAPLIERENENAAGVRVMVAVKQAARRSGIPWLIDAHSGKGEDQSDDADPLHALRGASGVAGVADFILSLRFSNGAFGTQRRLSGRGRFVSFAPIAIDFDPATGIYTVLDDPKTTAAESVWAQIVALDALDATPRTAHDLARRAAVAVDGRVTNTHRRLVAQALKGRAGVAIERQIRFGNQTTLYRRLEDGIA